MQKCMKQKEKKLHVVFDGFWPKNTMQNITVKEPLEGCSLNVFFYIWRLKTFIDLSQLWVCYSCI